MEVWVNWQQGQKGQAGVGGVEGEGRWHEEREHVGSRNMRVTEGLCARDRDGGGQREEHCGACSDLAGPRQELDYSSGEQREVVDF